MYIVKLKYNIKMVFYCLIVYTHIANLQSTQQLTKMTSAYTRIDSIDIN